MDTIAPSPVQDAVTTIQRCRNIIRYLDSNVLVHYGPQLCSHVQSLQKTLRNRMDEPNREAAALSRKVTAETVRKELEAFFRDKNGRHYLREADATSVKTPKDSREDLTSRKRDPESLKKRRVAALILGQAFERFERGSQRQQGGQLALTKMDRMRQSKARLPGKFQGNLEAFLNSSRYCEIGGARDATKLGTKLLYLVSCLNPDQSGLLFFSRYFAKLPETELEPLKSELETSKLLNSIADNHQGWFEKCMCQHEGKPPQTQRVSDVR